MRFCIKRNKLGSETERRVRLASAILQILQEDFEAFIMGFPYETSRLWFKRDKLTQEELAKLRKIWSSWNGLTTPEIIRRLKKIRIVNIGRENIREEKLGVAREAIIKRTVERYLNRLEKDGEVIGIKDKKPCRWKIALESAIKYVYSLTPLPWKGDLFTFRRQIKTPPEILEDPENFYEWYKPLIQREVLKDENFLESIAEIYLWLKKVIEKDHKSEWSPEEFKQELSQELRSKLLLLEFLEPEWEVGKDIAKGQKRLIIKRIKSLKLTTKAYKFHHILKRKEAHLLEIIKKLKEE